MSLLEKHKNDISFILRLCYKSDLWVRSNGLTTCKDDALQFECDYKGLTVDELFEFFVSELDEEWLNCFKNQLGDFTIESEVS